MKMIEIANEQYEISMFDIVSLYPYVNFSAHYPIGIPQLIRPKQQRVNWNR
jgi:hypothetical protein